MLTGTSGHVLLQVYRGMAFGREVDVFADEYRRIVRAGGSGARPRSPHDGVQVVSEVPRPCRRLVLVRNETVDSALRAAEDAARVEDAAAQVAWETARTIGRAGVAGLDSFDLMAELPGCNQAAHTSTLASRLGALAQANRSDSDGRVVGQSSAWRLLLLWPRMLLHPVRHGGEAGARVLRSRTAKFDHGSWGQLLNMSCE